MSDLKIIGTSLTTKATFLSDTGTTVTPGTVNLKYKKPNATTVTSVTVTPTNSEYSTEVLLDVAGTWYFRWESVGSGSAVNEFSVQVQESLLA